MLISPMREWLPTCNWMKFWDWYATTSLEFIYQVQENRNWHRHLRRNNSHRNYHIDYLVIHQPLLCPIQRASVSEGIFHITLLNASIPSGHTVNYNIPEKYVFDVVTIVKPETDWFMNRLSSSSSTELLYECLANGIALVVSDASYFPLTKTGACAWSIFHQTVQSLFKEVEGLRVPKMNRAVISANLEDSLE